MRIHDCFCGIGPWQKRDKLLPYQTTEILKLMDHFGIAKALVHSNFTNGGGAPERGNDMLRKACAVSDRFAPAPAFQLYPYADAPDLHAMLDEMRRSGAKAVWHNVLRPDFMPTWLYGDKLEACAAHKLPLLVHRDDAGPDALDRMLTDFPTLRVVLLGASYAEDWCLYPLLRRHPNLHIALGNCFVGVDNPQRFLRHFPAERLLFGSGLPHFSPGGLIAHVMYGDISDDDREKILSGNVERLISEVTL